jgi:hypothetical protein
MQKNTLPTILMNDANRDRWDLKLKTFHDFTFAPWNKLVFEKYFKQDFNKDKADNKMGGRKPDSNKKESKNKKQDGQKTNKREKSKQKKRKSEPSF